MKLLRCIFIGFLFPLLGCHSGKAQNLALGKRYTLSVAPNYPLGAPPSDTTLLTDGIFTKKGFWASRTTSGWQKISLLKITIDLGNPAPVHSVSFNTAAGKKSGVTFPANIYVFLSNDDKNFSYEGDAAYGVNKDSVNIVVREFTMNNINQLARYVSLIIIPKGSSVFCDEITVMKGNEGRKLTHTFSDLMSVVDSLKTREFEKGELLGYLDRLDTSKNYGDIYKKEIPSIQKKLEESDFNSDTIYKDIFRIHREELKSKFRGNFVIEKYNPWKPVDKMQISTEDADVLDYDFQIPEGGVQYGAFLVTNISLQKQEITFEIPEKDSGFLQLYAVLYVPSINFTRIADPLIPVKDKLLLNPGVTQMIFFKIQANHSGVNKSTITLKDNGAGISVEINYRAVHLIHDDTLNAVNWAYLNFPMLKKISKEVGVDLYTHHINTVVVPPPFIPKLGQTDFSKLTGYLSDFVHVKYVLLSVGYAIGVKSKGTMDGFMSDQWKKSFLDWYHLMINSLEEAGYSADRIYLYPYDEIKYKEVPDFSAFAKWAKQVIPGIKLYCTFTNRQSLLAMLPWMNIAQVSNQKDMYENLPSHNCQVWIYQSGAPARSLSPYSFYRLMSWQAFALNFSGVGFWNYADIGKDKKANLITDPYLNARSDYSVIYNGSKNEIISSRRWEAFRLGMEDYSVLKSYGRLFGMGNAQELANEVINDPKDYSKADSIRDVMLEKIREWSHR